MSEQMVVNTAKHEPSTFPPDNYAIISGTLDKPFSYSHSTEEKDFYQSTISVKRQSGTVDTVPIVVFKDLLPEDDHAGIFIEVKGSVRSYLQYNTMASGYHKVFVFANYLHVCDKEEELTQGPDMNHVYLTGSIHLLKGPRQTPLGRTITDVILRINRKSRRFYIPCIMWGNNAQYIANMKFNDTLRIFGRFQSRMYFKQFSPDSAEGEFRTAYEISVITVKKI